MAKKIIVDIGITHVGARETIVDLGQKELETRHGTSITFFQ